MLKAIKVLPLGVLLPLAIGAASVNPKDAESNIATWLSLLGLNGIPAWMVEKSFDNRVLVIALILSAVYVFAVWILPYAVWLARRRVAVKAILLDTYRRMQHSVPTQSGFNRDTVLMYFFVVVWQLAADGRIKLRGVLAGTARETVIPAHAIPIVTPADDYNGLVSKYNDTYTDLCITQLDSIVVKQAIRSRVRAEFAPRTPRTKVT